MAKGGIRFIKTSKEKKGVKQTTPFYFLWKRGEITLDKLRITVVGQDIFKIVAEKMLLVRINNAKQVNSGMLGNLKTLTYEIEIPENEVIFKRRELMEKMAEDNMRLMPMYVHGDWMRILVMKPLML